MAYSTNTSIIALLPTLPQTTTSAGFTATSALIDSHIFRADNLINAKVSRRYVASSLVPTPPIIQSLSEDIASYYTLRSVYSGDNQNVSEWVEKFQESIEMLDQIRDGLMNIVDSTGSNLPASTTVGKIESNTEDSIPFFDVGKSVDWEFDDKQIETERNA